MGGSKLRLSNGVPRQSKDLGSVEVVNGGNISWNPGIYATNSLQSTGGTGNGAEAPYNASFFNQTVNLSIAAWFKTSNNNAGFGGIFGQGSIPLEQRKLYFGMDSSSIVFVASPDGSAGPTSKIYTTTSNFDDNQWHLGVMTFASDDLKVYIDGQELTGGDINLVRTGSFTNLFAATNPIVLNSFWNNSTTDPQLAFNGLTRDHSWWNKVLSAAEIEELYNDGVPYDIRNHSANANLIEYWSVDGSDGTTITGLQNGQDATIVGNLTISTDVPASGGELMFDAALQVEIPGLSYLDNNIPTTESPINLLNDKDVAYIIPNLTTGGNNLDVTVDTLNNVPSDAVVIARRDSDSLLLGSSKRFPEIIQAPVEVMGGGNKNWSNYNNSGSFDHTNGTDANVVIPYNATPFGALVDFSANIWVKANNNASFQVAFGHSGRKWFLGFDDSGFAAVYVASTAGSWDKQYESTTVYADNTWHMLTMTYASNDLRLYVDGVELTVGDGTLTKVADVSITNLFASTLNVTIGALDNNAASSNSLHVDGYTDEASYWTKVLTSAEITELYNNGFPKDLKAHSAKSDLVAWYNAEDGDVATFIKDKIGSNDAAGEDNGSGTNLEISTDIPVSTYELSFDAPLYVEVPGLNYVDNTIPITESALQFPNNLDTAYAVLNTSSGGNDLNITVSTLNNVPNNAVIIARRDGSSIKIGTEIIEDPVVYNWKNIKANTFSEWSDAFEIPQSSNKGAFLTDRRDNFGGTVVASYQGAVLGSNGIVYMVPRDANGVLAIDTNNQTASLETFGLSLADSGKWLGGVLGPDDKAYFVPFGATDILVIDTKNNTAIRSNLGATLTGGAKWAGGCLGTDNKIYCAPLNASDICIIDPLGSSATRSSLGASISGSDQYIGATLGANGKIYCTPFNSTDVLIIDTANQTASESNLGATLTGSAKWVGGTLAPNGKIYCAPFSATDILVINTNDETAIRSNLGATISSSYYGSVLAPDGKIYCIPRNATNVLVIDPDTDTAETVTFTADLTGTAKWAGGVLAPDGRIYAAPAAATDVWVFGRFYDNHIKDVILSTYINKL